MVATFDSERLFLYLTNGGFGWGCLGALPGDDPETIFVWRLGLEIILLGIRILDTVRSQQNGK